MSRSSSNQSNFGFFTLLAVAVLPVFNFFLFGAFQLYAGNADEFASGFGNILPRIVPAMSMVWLVLVVIGLALGGGLRDRYLFLLFGLGLLIWVQGAFVVGDYGVFDGRGIAWQAFAWPAWLDVLLWVGVLAGFVVWYRDLGTILLPATAALIVFQFAAAGYLGVTSESRLWSARTSIDTGPPAGIFRYSADSNIVHVILDNFQTDIFEELVEDEVLEAALDGFVLFRENAAVTPYTSLAIPSIFSGRVYGGTEPASTFFNRGLQDGFQGRLHEIGYTVNLATLQSLAGSSHDHKYRLPDIYGATARQLIQHEANQLLDISLFRHVPHLFKRWVYNENNWRLRSLIADPEVLPKSFAHKQFFSEYMQRMEVTAKGPAYHYLHLWPPHPPYVTTSDGKYAGRVLPSTRLNYKNEARDILLKFIDFLTVLKQQGIYDDTLIILHSDHGGEFEPDFSPARVLALKAIKPRNSRGKLRVSNAQVSLTDIGATIFQQEGIDIDWPGQSVFDVSEGQVRARQYVAYQGNHQKYLSTVRIKGSLYQADSYSYLEPIELDRSPATYVYGEVVDFGLQGVGSMYLGEGWSTPAPGVVWNDGYKASLEIPVDPPDNDLELTLWLRPAIHGDALPRQRIAVYVGDEQVGRWELERPEGASLKARIPAEMVSSDELVVRLDLPDAANQAELGVGGDRRLQAIALRRFRLEQIP